LQCQWTDSNCCCTVAVYCSVSELTAWQNDCRSNSHTDIWYQFHSTSFPIQQSGSHCLMYSTSPHKTTLKTVRTFQRKFAFLQTVSRISDEQELATGCEQSGCQCLQAAQKHTTLHAADCRLSKCTSEQHHIWLLLAGSLNWRVASCELNLFGVCLR